MPIMRAQVVLPYQTGLPEDVITNTLHFDVPAPLDPDVQVPILTSHLSEFYLSVYGSVGGGGHAQYVNWSQAHVNWYNLSDPVPRVPTIEPLPFPGISVSPTTTPVEVCVVIAFQGERVAGLPQARRRGRLYLGGFVNVCQSTPATAPPRVLATLVTAIANAGTELLSDCSGDGTPWVVWSPTNGDAVPISDGWVDNEPDTQRRRGIGASQRTLWT